jgi:ABC-type antimicrobial peptide transport system permease subunit
MAAAAWLSRFIAAMLFEVPALDPLTFAAVAAVLGATASIATLVPAVRALRVSPLTALRTDG